MTHALVTGATGFIGHHLVNLLCERDYEVSCLVRPQSDRSGLEPLAPKYCLGDVNDLDSLRGALKGIDVVFHLAGLTKSLHAGDLHRVNDLGTQNLSQACADASRTPVLVIASSLAAAGPAPPNRPREESDPLTPVSDYGRSKLAGERSARRLGHLVPTTIIRPPVVFGERDKDGFNLFQGIATFGVHLVPGRQDYLFSSIHARDLALALLLAAEKGRRAASDESSGVYFAADEQSLSYAEFGRMIGRGVGRPNAWVVRTPEPMVWTVSAMNQLYSKLRRSPHILNLDKAREATAGSWSCSPARLRSETGFRCEWPLEDRLAQTIDWYRQQGWLKSR
jgi:nucleoside-diphosphate-sugar epimerase